MLAWQSWRLLVVGGFAGLLLAAVYGNAQHPEALAAYNAWLQDPAISAQHAQKFAAQSGGAMMSLYQNLMSGGDRG